MLGRVSTIMLSVLLVACQRPREVRGLYVSQDGSGMVFPCDDPTARLVVQDSVLDHQYRSMTAGREPLFVRVRGTKSRTGSPKGGGQQHLRIQQVLEMRARASGECPGVAQPIAPLLSTP